MTTFMQSPVQNCQSQAYLHLKWTYRRVNGYFLHKTQLKLVVNLCKALLLTSGFAKA